MSDLRDDELSRLYREAGCDEPSAGVDAAILAAARQALAAAPARRRSAWLSWLAPAGLAATVVLTISVVMLTRHEQPDLLPAPAQTPATPAAAPASATAADSRPRQEATLPAATLPPESPPAKSTARKPLPERPAETAPSPPAPPAVAPVSEPFPAAATAGAVMKAPAVAPTAAEAASARQSLASPVGPAPVMESTAAPDRALAAPRPAPAAARALPPAARSGVDPETWLETIRRLKRQGDVDAAREQLAAFRRSYPDWPLPDDLRD